MNPKEGQNLRLFGWLAALAAALQAVGLIRYLQRLPEDWIGIALYTITMVAFILVSIGSFLQARRKAD